MNEKSCWEKRQQGGMRILGCGQERLGTLPICSLQMSVFQGESSYTDSFLDKKKKIIEKIH